MATPQVPATPAEEPTTPQEQTSEPTTTPTSAAPEGQQEAPKFVTKDELEQVTTEIIRRVKQSDRDRNRQIETQLKTISEQLANANVAISDEQKVALRTSIADQIDSQETQTDETQVSEQLQPEVRFVYDQIDAAMANVGESVTPNDPEWKILKEALDDPKGSLAKTILAANQAATAKKARVTSQKESASARVAGGGEQTPGEPVAKKASEYWDRAHSQQ